MKITLEAAEIEQAVTLWINKMYVATHDAKVKITAVTGTSYNSATGYTVEADVTIPTGEANT